MPMLPDRLRMLARCLAALSRGYQAGRQALTDLLDRYAVSVKTTRKGTPMPEIRTLRLDPPQPCGMLNPLASGQICGKPATLATAEAAPVSVSGPAGYLLVLPICADCARIHRKLAGVVAAPQAHDVVLATVSVVLPTAPAPAVLEAAAQLLDENIARMQRDARILRERATEIARRN